MKIAIIGAGRVGRALGLRWAQKGHEIIFGARDLKSANVQKALSEIGANAKVVSVKEAAASAKVIVLAIPFSACQAVVQSLGNLRDKILVDSTNPFKSDLSDLSVAAGTSGAQEIARFAKNAQVVKAFNCTGNNNMENPIYGNDRISMFICGDSQDAKKVVKDLTEEIDFEVVDAGDLVSARCLEFLALLWVRLARMQNYGRDWAFKLVKRP